MSTRDRGDLAGMEMTAARAIGPAYQEEWPGDRTAPLYWVARRVFELDRQGPFGLRVAAERHYEVYLNGRLCFRRRNFWNGDECVFGQTWTSGPGNRLRPGQNLLEVVVRSDPWRNKNHRCFRPFLLLEMHDLASGALIIASDGSWKVAVIDGWREMIALGGNGTIHFERVRVPLGDKAVLSGFREGLDWREPRLPDSPLPPLYQWNDAPMESLVRHPRVLESGACRFVDTVFDFDLSAIPPGPSTGTGLSWTTELDSAGPGEIELAGPALGSCDLTLNGQLVFRHDNLPDRHQMQLPSYLIPAGSFPLVAGRNTLAFVVRARPLGSPQLSIGLGGLDKLPARVVWTDPSGSKGRAVQSRSARLAERMGAKVWRKGPGGASVSEAPQLLRVGAAGPSPFSVVLDFGGVVNAALSFRVRSASAGRLSLAYGFALQRGAVDCDKMALRAVDVLELGPGESRYSAFDRRCFRYLDLVFEGFAGEVEVADIEAEEPVFMRVDRFAMETSDSRLDEVCRAAVRTAVLCADELYVDNPDREHAQWADPTLAISSAGHYLAGAEGARKSRKVLHDLLSTQQPDGQWAGYAPGKWFPRIPLQCHMALVSTACHRLYMHTADAAFGAQALDAVLGAIGHWERHRVEGGLVADLHTVFVDWGSHVYSYGRGCSGKTGALTTMNCYVAGVLERAAEIARWLGRRSVQADLEARAAAARASIRDQLYDRACGLFRDGVGSPEAERAHSQTANCLAVWAGAAPAGLAASILRRAFDPPRGLDVIPANALFFAMLGAEVLFESGCGDLALSVIGERYGAMVDAGPGSLWETWYPHASLCQGTGAGLVYACARYLAGIYPAEPGYARVGVDPRPSGLERLHARLLTPVGEIGVRWEARGATLDFELSLPEALRGTPLVKPEAVDGMRLELRLQEPRSGGNIDPPAALGA